MSVRQSSTHTRVVTKTPGYFAFTISKSIASARPSSPRPRYRLTFRIFDKADRVVSQLSSSSNGPRPAIPRVGGRRHRRRRLTSSSPIVACRRRGRSSPSPAIARRRRASFFAVVGFIAHRRRRRSPHRPSAPPSSSSSSSPSASLSTVIINTISPWTAPPAHRPDCSHPSSPALGPSPIARAPRLSCTCRPGLTVQCQPSPVRIHYPLQLRQSSGTSPLIDVQLPDQPGRVLYYSSNTAWFSRWVARQRRIPPSGTELSSSGLRAR